MRISAPLVVSLGLLVLGACGKTPPRALLTPDPAGVGRDAGPGDGRPLDFGGFPLRDVGGPDFGLPPLDGGPPDEGAPDSGPPDTGAPDLGSPDAGSPLCELSAAPITIQVSPANSLQGRARVISAAPLVFDLEGGGRVRVALSPATPAPRVQRGALYEVVIERGRPMGDEWFIVIQTIESPSVIFAAWSTSELPEGFLEYAASPCGRDPLGCGELDRLSLVIPTDRGVTRIEPGDRASVFGYTVVNGRSTEYRVGPSCPETPARWLEGAITLP